MLTEDERTEITAEIGRHPHKRAACIEALKIVQRNRGWVSDEIRDIAALLDMTPEELDAVATFYSLIHTRPVGKHVILVCDSVTCWVMGYEQILECLTERCGSALGGTSSDGQFTLLPVACLGACDRAPAMMVDGELFTDLTPERVNMIIDRYRS